MKKFLVLLCGLFIIAGCASIKETKSEINDALLKQALGGYTFFCYVLPENDFKQRIKGERDSIIENGNLSLKEKEKRVKEIDSIVFTKNQYLLFAIRHMKAVHRDLAASRVELIDSKGKPAGKLFVNSTYKVLWADQYSSGSFYVSQWIIKADKQLDKANFTDLPLMLKANFMGSQRKEYRVLDK